MDKNLNSVQQESLILLLREALKKVAELQKELLLLKKRVQVLEP